MSTRSGRRATLPALLLALVALPAAAADYHVDCRDGSDAHDGRSPATAWRSLERVNAKVFSPGDSVLLRRGTRCTGALWPKGSGEPGRPIRLAAYGVGPLPVVDAGGAESAVRLFDQEHWEIEALEATGGSPYGIRVSGSRGVLRHFRLRNVVVHGVGGEVKAKTSGLVVFDAGGGGQTFEDVVIDGVTAYDSTQWAGIVVHGAAWADKGLRARQVTIRNSIVHDVFGDGIVLFQVEDGLIERSAAWRTGLQPRETIGTPNGIWTWRCRRCTVQWTEGFFVDSPGVDGGVYDIDWGNDDNVVQDNFGHDSMGYCASVFAAAGETTTNSTVRRNVCVNNGRSPKLALRQGDLFVSTWEGGKLDGVRIHNNTFYWNPPVDAPALQMDHAEFAGTRPNVFEANLVHSTVPRMVHSNDGLRLDRNLYWYPGHREPVWSYGGREHVGFSAYRRDSGQDAGGVCADPKLTATLRLRSGSPAIDAAGPDIGAVEHAPAGGGGNGSAPSGERYRRPLVARVPSRRERRLAGPARLPAERPRAVRRAGARRGGGFPRWSLQPAEARLESRGGPDLRAWRSRGWDAAGHAPGCAGRDGGSALGGPRSPRRPGPHPASPARAAGRLARGGSCPGTFADRQKGRMR